MENMDLVLDKQSGSSEIEAYFLAVRRLWNLSERFPVNLDSVWMLIYPRKDHAVRELTNNFIQGVDYQILPKNEKNSKAGRPANEYHLSVSCLEYFIARKKREVFEVYRQVFHRVANSLNDMVNFGGFHVPETYGETLQLAADLQHKLEEARPKIEFYNKLVEDQDYFTTSHIARELGISPQTLNKFLLDIFKNGYHRNICMVNVDEAHKDWQCTPIETNKSGNRTQLVRWTKTGREGILNLCCEHKIS